MITDDQHELLKDIINNTERPDKLSVRLDPVSKTLTIEYDDMDEEWFREMLDLTPNVGLTGQTTAQPLAGPAEPKA